MSKIVKVFFVFAIVLTMVFAPILEVKRAMAMWSFGIGFGISRVKSEDFAGLLQNYHGYDIAGNLVCSGPMTSTTVQLPKTCVKLRIDAIVTNIDDPEYLHSFSMFLMGGSQRTYKIANFVQDPVNMDLGGVQISGYFEIPLDGCSSGNYNIGSSINFDGEISTVSFFFFSHESRDEKNDTYLNMNVQYGEVLGNTYAGNGAYLPTVEGVVVYTPAPPDPNQQTGGQMQEQVQQQNVQAGQVQEQIQQQQTMDELKSDVEFSESEVKDLLGLVLDLKTGQKIIGEMKTIVVVSKINRSFKVGYETDTMQEVKFSCQKNGYWFFVMPEGLESQTKFFVDNQEIIYDGKLMLVLLTKKGDASNEESK